MKLNLDRHIKNLLELDVPSVQYVYLFGNTYKAAYLTIDIHHGVSIKIRYGIYADGKMEQHFDLHEKEEAQKFYNQLGNE